MRIKHKELTKEEKKMYHYNDLAGKEYIRNALSQQKVQNTVFLLGNIRCKKTFCIFITYNALKTFKNTAISSARS